LSSCHSTGVTGSERADADVEIDDEKEAEVDEVGVHAAPPLGSLPCVADEVVVAADDDEPEAANAT